MVLCRDNQSTEKHPLISPVRSCDLNEGFRSRDVDRSSEQHRHCYLSPVYDGVDKLSEFNMEGVAKGGVTMLGGGATETMVDDIDSQLYQIDKASRQGEAEQAMETSGSMRGGDGGCEEDGRGHENEDREGGEEMWN